MNSLEIELLVLSGNILYGDRWQTAVARLCKVSDRTVRRWARGDSNIPQYIFVGLEGALLIKSNEMQEVIRRLSVISRAPSRAPI